MKIHTTVLLSALLGLLVACGESPENTPPATSTEPTRTTSPAETVTPRADFRIPPEGFQTDARRGRELFQANCMQCHGAEARGTDQGPPLIHRIYEPSHHSDLAFYIAMARGVHQHHWNFGDMPPIPAVDGEDAAHIIAWIRQEQRAVGIY
ncbi:c-type cytochrome [Thioalkalivibrio sulfidiphilus]|uniref:c-type cytochrome n=1 Tax=Thioalkalivibrio sulfidiphilus TaxID=1033854 RepID=UPI000380DC81|nr:cytochrome c [Thioalkalivibrio sulfidiphilus]